MAEVEFKFDISRDAKNYWETANSSKHWGYDFSKDLRPNIIKMLRGKKWDKSTQDEIYNLLKENYKNDEKELDKRLNLIKKDWKKVEKEYFRRLAKITKHPIYTKKFTAIVTTIGRCPYFPSENAFMIQIFGSPSKRLTIAHEIMHLQFIHYYQEKLRGILTPDKFQDLKEALTVLLNVGFSDLIKNKDLGYPSHEKLRAFIEKEWKKDPDFDVLLNKCIRKL